MAKYTDKAPQVNELDDLAAGIRAYVITTYQTNTLPAEYGQSKNPTGNWCWILNDGNLPSVSFPAGMMHLKMPWHRCCTTAMSWGVR